MASRAQLGVSGLVSRVRSGKKEHCKGESSSNPYRNLRRLVLTLIAAASACHPAALAHTPSSSSADTCSAACSASHTWPGGRGGGVGGGAGRGRGETKVCGEGVGRGRMPQAGRRHSARSCFYMGYDVLARHCSSLGSRGQARFSRGRLPAFSAQPKQTMEGATARTQAATLRPCACRTHPWPRRTG